MAERAQHTIVKIEQLLASPVIDPQAVDELEMDARKLLDELETVYSSR